MRIELPVVVDFRSPDRLEAASTAPIDIRNSLYQKLQRAIDAADSPTSITLSLGSDWSIREFNSVMLLSALWHVWPEEAERLALEFSVPNQFLAVRWRVSCTAKNEDWQLIGNSGNEIEHCGLDEECRRSNDFASAVYDAACGIGLMPYQDEEDAIDVIKTATITTPYVGSARIAFTGCRPNLGPLREAQFLVSDYGTERKALLLKVTFHRATSIN